MPESNLPKFFLSYARNDNTPSGGGEQRLVEKFFDRLQQGLAQAAGHVITESNSIGTLDTRNVGMAKDWQSALKRALAECQCMVALYSATYFRREICGKEMGIFISRHNNINVTKDGELTGITNIVPIRWYEEDHYTKRAMADGSVPTFLRLVSYHFGDPGGNLQRSNAIKYYSKFGMKKCLSNAAYSGWLFDLLVKTITDFQPLPKVDPATLSFGTAVNAFTHDWAVQFANSPTAPSTGVADDITLVDSATLQPFLNTVILHVTDKRVSGGYRFSTLSNWPLVKGSSNENPAFDRLIVDIESAAREEGSQVVHAVVDNLKLEAVAAQFSEQKIPVIVAIDPDVWPTVASKPPHSTYNDGASIQQLLMSERWSGVVLAPQSTDTVTARKNRLFRLPSDGSDRKGALIAAFARTRADSIAAAPSSTMHAERMPLLGATKPRTE